MYAPNTTVKTTTGKQAEIIKANTVEVMTEQGDYIESTSYDVYIKSQGIVSLHESNIIG